MVIAIIYLIFSFILDNFMSNVFFSSLSNESYFATIYILIAFVIIYSYFDNEKKYFVLLIIFGLVFDVLYTGTFVFNLVIFFVIGMMIKLFNNIFPNNMFTSNLISIAIICMYHIISFIVLGFVSDVQYGFILLINIIVHSFISTIIYTSISYMGMRFLFNRFGVKHIK